MIIWLFLNCKKETGWKAAILLISSKLWSLWFHFIKTLLNWIPQKWDVSYGWALFHAEVSRLFSVKVLTYKEFYQLLLVKSKNDILPLIITIQSHSIAMIHSERKYIIQFQELTKNNWELPLEFHDNIMKSLDKISLSWEWIPFRDKYWNWLDRNRYWLWTHIQWPHNMSEQ